MYIYIYIIVFSDISYIPWLNHCTNLSNIIIYHRLLIVIELDKNVDMYLILCDFMWLRERDSFLCYFNLN